MIDTLEIADFLDQGACLRLREELRQAVGAPATLLGRDPASAVAPQIRRVTRAAIPTATARRLVRLLMERKPAIERHFGVVLDKCEEPQFLRYQPGDFFVPHQDGNTPLVHDDSRFRKISAVLFLNAQSEETSPGTYGGGSFVFHGSYPDLLLRVPIAPAPGTLVAFRAETTHEVTPVTHGERFSVVTWFR